MQTARPAQTFVWKRNTASARFLLLQTTGSCVIGSIETGQKTHALNIQMMLSDRLHGERLGQELRNCVGGPQGIKYAGPQNVFQRFTDGWTVAYYLATVHKLFD